MAISAVLRCIQARFWRLEKSTKNSISQPSRARTVANFSCRGSWAQQLPGSAPNSDGGFELRFWWFLQWPSAFLRCIKKAEQQAFPSLPERAQRQILAVEEAGLSNFQDQLLTLKADSNCDFGESYSGPRPFCDVSKKQEKQHFSAFPSAHSGKF